MKLSRHIIKYGSLEIPFTLQQESRKTLSIDVYPDLTVEVKAPITASLGQIQERLKKRGAWIKKQQQYFEKFLPRTPKREYVNGETHKYLGRQYMLKIKKSKDSNIKLYRGRLVVETSVDNKDYVKLLLSQWYERNAKRIFQERFEELSESFIKKQKVGKKPRLQMKRLSRKWGSCSNGGLISLNPELIKAPKSCVDYVIVHELCHLVHPNHSKDYFEVLEKQLPNWKELKERLELVMV